MCINACSMCMRAMFVSDEYGSPEGIRRPVVDDLPTDLSPSERMEALQERCQIMREEGCLDEIVDVKVQMLAMSRMIYGLRSAQTAQSLWDLAETYMELENPEQASRHLRDAHEILSECREASARKLFPKLLLTIGVCHTLLGRYVVPLLCCYCSLFSVGLQSFSSLLSSFPLL
jgi:hypothetical protein